MKDASVFRCYFKPHCKVIETLCNHIEFLEYLIVYYTCNVAQFNTIINYVDLENMHKYNGTVRTLKNNMFSD